MHIVFEHMFSNTLQDFCLDFTTSGCTVLFDPSEQYSQAVLSVLVGLDEIYSGQLWLDGKAHAEFFKLDPLIVTLGCVFDEGIMLSNLTLRENLLLPWRKRFEGETEKTFDDSLSYWMQQLDLKIDINLRPASLSPAERKFMGYIRSFMLKSRLLLIDDPFYLLNKTHRHQMFQFLTLQKQNQAMLIASADDKFRSDFATQVIDLSPFCH